MPGWSAWWSRRRPRRRPSCGRPTGSPSCFVPLTLVLAGAALGGQRRPRAGGGGARRGDALPAAAGGADRDHVRAVAGRPHRRRRQGRWRAGTARRRPRHALRQDRNPDAGAAAPGVDVVTAADGIDADEDAAPRGLPRPGLPARARRCDRHRGRAAAVWSSSCPRRCVEQHGYGVEGRVGGARGAPRQGRLDRRPTQPALGAAGAPAGCPRRLADACSWRSTACAAGAFLLEDPVRPDAPRMIRALRGAGISRVVLVTGDRADIAETVGRVVGVDAVMRRSRPGREARGHRARESRNGPTIMVGDGVNDAPAPGRCRRRGGTGRARRDRVVGGRRRRPHGRPHRRARRRDPHRPPLPADRPAGVRRRHGPVR